MCLRWIDEKSAIVISKQSRVLVFVFHSSSNHSRRMLIVPILDYRHRSCSYITVTLSHSRGELFFFLVSKTSGEDDVTGDESKVLHKKKRKGKNYTRGFFSCSRAHSVSGGDTFQSVIKGIHVCMRILFLRTFHARSSPLIAVQLKDEHRSRRGRHN